MIYRFMAKQDYNSSNWDIFFEKDNLVYFIEDQITRKWFTKEHEWTLDPLKALSFKTDIRARTFAVENKLSGWVIIERKIT